MSTVRAELRKLTTTRTTAGLCLAALLVVAVGTFSTTSAADRSQIDGPLHHQQSFLLASVNLSLFALLIGVRSATDEFRYGTISWTLLAVRARAGIVGAKVAVAAGVGAAMAAAASAALLAVAVAVVGRRGAEIALVAEDGLAVVGLILASALWAAIGVSVGMLIRHQVAAVVTVLTWVLLVENLGGALLGEAGRYLPGQAAHALSRAEAAPELVEPLVGAVLLIALTGLAAGLAATTLSRRPVPLPS